MVGKLFDTEPFKSRKQGLQRPRARSDRAAERRAPSAHGRQPPHRDRRAVQHLRFGALRADARRSPHARRRVVRAVRLPRDPGQREARTAAAESSTIRPPPASTARSPNTSSCMSSDITSPALADEYYTSPVSYTTGGGSEHPEPWEPNVTANGAHPKWQTDPRCAASDAVGQGRIREAQPRGAGGTRARARCECAGERDGQALHRGARVGDEVSFVAEVRRESGRVRRSGVRAARTLSPGDRLHHVHARRGRFLPRVPAGDRADHRRVFAGNA